ncbi:MAG: PEGA domain-containing protein [Polyangiaceae bacterium]|nr:PEGA domain-containing protein [Polyangiaceae bacterium]
MRIAALSSRCWGRRCSALLLLTAVATAPLTASAQGAPGQPATSEDAGSSFERGVKFFHDGDYVAAMVQFKRAYELDPNYVVLYNIGQTARELKNYSEALQALEKYLAEGGAQIDAERRTRVEGWVAELKEKVATVTLKTNVEGADIAVDDVAVGRTPLDKPVVMDAGKRKISAIKEGYAPLTRYVEVAGAEQKTVALDLVSLTGPKGPDTGPDVKGPMQPEIKHTPWPWIGLGVTAAAGIATGVVGGLAFGKKSEFEDALAAFPGNPETIENTRTDAKTFATTADVLGGVTGGFAVLTIIAFAVDYGRSPPKAAPTAEAKKTSFTPIVAPTYVGLRADF